MPSWAQFTKSLALSEPGEVTRLTTSPYAVTLAARTNGSIIVLESDIGALIGRYPRSVAYRPCVSRISVVVGVSPPCTERGRSHKPGEECQLLRPVGHAVRHRHRRKQKRV